MALIDQDATVLALVQLHEETGVKTAQAIRVVREMQEADAVEVVRCFECKYHYKDGDNVVTSHCLLNHNHVQPSDWFCADGERKEVKA